MIIRTEQDRQQILNKIISIDLDKGSVSVVIIEGIADIRKLSSEELSQRFYEAYKRRALAEKAHFHLDEHRKRLLDVLTLQIMADDPGISHAKASSKARASDEFKTHLEGQAEAVQERFEAMGAYHECDFEIKRRLNVSFAKSREYSAGRLQT